MKNDIANKSQDIVFAMPINKSAIFAQEAVKFSLFIDPPVDMFALQKSLMLRRAAREYKGPLVCIIHMWKSESYLKTNVRMSLNMC